jgi:hypothetical protein
MIIILTACGGALNGTNGTLTSPNYPDTYTNGGNCEWTLAVEGEGMRMVTLTFLTFNLQYSPNCFSDSLEVSIFFFAVDISLFSVL